MQILSFDIGGSKIAYATVNESGKITSAVQTVSTPQTAVEIEQILRAATTEHCYDACALATAGVVFHSKLQGKPNNLPKGYDTLDFADIFKAPFIIENDANAAMYAEHKIGNLRGINNGIMLTLGTDTGCALICDGHILRGKCGAPDHCREKK